MNPLRVGVAGAGRIFELVHLPNWKRLVGAKLVAVVDSDVCCLQRWEEFCVCPKKKFCLAVQKFLDGVRSGEVFSPSLRDGLASLPCFV
jgi:hypothetical protein